MFATSAESQGSATDDEKQDGKTVCKDKDTRTELTQFDMVNDNNALMSRYATSQTYADERLSTEGDKSDQRDKLIALLQKHEILK